MQATVPASPAIHNARLCRLPGDNLFFQSLLFIENGDNIYLKHK